MSRRTRSVLGFTLIELLVVIAVISVLAGLVAPAVFRNVGDAKVSAARAQLELLALGLEQYRMDNDYYPTTEQGLDALWSAPAGEPVPRNWRGPYLRKSTPPDPWGNVYQYVFPSRDRKGTYDLRSLGRDGREGGEGEDEDLIQ